MDRRQLECFIGVAENGSFRKAAEALHVSQPALSRTIQSLERELGVPLFRRTRRGIMATEAAARLLPRARTILAEFEGLAAAARDPHLGPAGRVTVALMSSPAIEPMTSIVAAARQEFPGIVTTGVAFSNASSAIAAISLGVCDAGIVASETQPPTADDLRVERLYDDQLVLAVPRDITIPGTGEVTTKQLRGLPFIAAPPGSIMRRVLDDLRTECDIVIVAEVAHREAMLPMVHRGIGLAIVPRSLWETAASTDAMSRRDLAALPATPRWLVARTDLSEAGRAFVDLARRVATDPPGAWRRYLSGL